jgi:hypothetical protein
MVAVTVCWYDRPGSGGRSRAVPPVTSHSNHDETDGWEPGPCQTAERNSWRPRRVDTGTASDCTYGEGVSGRSSAQSPPRCSRSATHSTTGRKRSAGPLPFRTSESLVVRRTRPTPQLEEAGTRRPRNRHPIRWFRGSCRYNNAVRERKVRRDVTPEARSPLAF